MSRTPDRSSILPKMKEVILRSHRDVVLIVDSSMKVLWVNEAAVQMFDRPIDDLVGSDCTTITRSSPHLSVIPSALATAFRKGSQVTKSVSDAQHIRLTIRITPLLDGDGRPRAASVSIRPEATRNPIVAVDAQTLDWHKVLDAIGYGTIILDSQQRITYANRSILHALGDPPESEVIGKHCYEIFHSTDAPPAGCPFLALRASAFQAPSMSGHMDMLGRDVMVSVAPIIGNDDVPLLFVHVSVDISDRLLAEEAAMLYLDILSHDIANHLQTILLGVTILAKDQDDEIARLVFTSIDNIDRLIIKARAVEGLDSAPLGEVVLQDILEPLLLRLKSQYSDVEIVTDLPFSPCTTYANRFLEIAFEALLDNAVRYNPHDNKTVWVSIHPVNDGWLVKIADNGPGIPDYRKESLLNRSRRFGGMGIHQSSLIIRWFGGTLSIRDRVPQHPEEGVVFVLWLPGMH
ncbi:MAG: PAS domain-containing sensor histidine kinase [Candidatus Thorarchaeota archaeon]|nr:PAS domain-containing sensor histidine kinase [Candidatus Thorarchaeota archaeon]